MRITWKHCWLRTCWYLAVNRTKSSRLWLWTRHSQSRYCVDHGCADCKESRLMCVSSAYPLKSLVYAHSTATLSHTKCTEMNSGVRYCTTKMPHKIQETSTSAPKRGEQCLSTISFNHFIHHRSRGPTLRDGLRQIVERAERKRVRNSLNKRVMQLYSLSYQSSKVIRLAIDSFWP